MARFRSFQEPPLLAPGKRKPCCGALKHPFQVHEGLIRLTSEETLSSMGEVLDFARLIVTRNLNYCPESESLKRFKVAVCSPGEPYESEIHCRLKQNRCFCFFIWHHLTRIRPKRCSWSSFRYGESHQGREKIWMIPGTISQCYYLCIVSVHCGLSAQFTMCT